MQQDKQTKEGEQHPVGHWIMSYMEHDDKFSQFKKTGTESSNKVSKLPGTEYIILWINVPFLSTIKCYVQYW